jgi:threonine synthase
VTTQFRILAMLCDFLMLKVLRESGGFGIVIGDVEPARAEIARSDGIHLCPEGAATFGVYRQAHSEGRIPRADRVVLFNCATGLKYPLPPVTRSLDRHRPIDYEGL